MSLFTSFNGDCLDQIAFFFSYANGLNASAIGKVRWRLWHTTLKQRSPATIFNVEKMVEEKLGM